MSAPAVAVPGDERERLAALERYRILDTTPEEAFDEVAQLASILCDTPIALISLVDATRQFFKARVGLEAVQTPREVSFCAHAIHGDDVFVVQDALADPRFAENALVLGDPKIRFYAGALLRSPEGFRLGTLCVIDRKPRDLDQAHRIALLALARQVMAQLELRRRMEDARREIERLKKDFVSLVSHELRTPLTSIRGSLGLLTSGVMGELTAEARQTVEVAERNSVHLMTLINNILDFQKLERGKVEMELRDLVRG
jgi:signal transduction histidine kinase